MPVFVIPKYFSIGYVDMITGSIYDYSSNYPAKRSYYKPDSANPKYFGAASGTASFYARYMRVYLGKAYGSDVKSIISSCGGNCLKCISTLNTECISCSATYFFRNNSIQYGECCMLITSLPSSVRNMHRATPNKLPDMQFHHAPYQFYQSILCLQ